MKEIERERKRERKSERGSDREYVLDADVIEEEKGEKCLQKNNG